MRSAVVREAAVTSTNSISVTGSCLPQTCANMRHALSTLGTEYLVVDGLVAMFIYELYFLI